MSESPTSYRGVRAIVLGASGFIGRAVTDALVAAGADVIRVVRRPGAASPAAASDTAHVVADLARADLVRPVLARLRPAIVFNLAGYGVDPSERDARTAYRINVGIPVETVEALARCAVPWTGLSLVHVGSAAEYGAAGGDLGESRAPRPLSLYGRSKLAGTRALADRCRALAVRGATARLFTVYGPGEHAGRLLPSLLDAALGDAPLPLTAGLQRRDFTYLGDAVEGLLRLGVSAAAPGDVVNVATGRLHSVREFVEIAAAELGIAPARLQFGALPTRPDEMAHEAVRVARLRSLTGWVPSASIAEGVRKTATGEQG